MSGAPIGDRQYNRVILGLVLFVIVFVGIWVAKLLGLSDF